MRGIALAAGGAGGWGPHHFRRLQHRQVKCNASSAAQPSGNSSYLQRVQGWNGPLKAGLTSGLLSSVGDLLAQALVAQMDAKAGRPAVQYDPSRTLRMFGFGFFLYGPGQFYWYNYLDWLMPVKNTVNFISKVAANQLILAPIVLGSVFSWNLSLSGKGAEIPAKLQRDLLPTMMNGWKFWIPAASLNFYCIPLRYQVLYMSACGVLWTAYLSYASSTAIAPPVAEVPAAEAGAGNAPCCSGKDKKKK